MASRLLFDYEDSLSLKVQGTLPNSLVISKTSSEFLLILRLVSGAANITRIHDGKKIKQRKNYFAQDLKGYSSSWPSKFPKLFDATLTATDLGAAIDHIRFKKNRIFYRDILNELACYFAHSNEGSHTAAFIHIYRLLEYISYAFPMVYASNAPDFRGTYNYLKDWFGDSKTGKSELKFFEAFVKKIFEGDPVLNTTLEIDILTANADVQKTIYKTLKKTIPQDGFSTADSVEFQKIAINFPSMGGFIICARNYFVHYLSRGDENYSAMEIIDSDLLYSFINDKCLFWISVILLEIIRFNLIQSKTV